MASSLERVSTVHQTSMGATRLPLELQQQVYSYLDVRSYAAARDVCKWWHFASLDTMTMVRQLQKLPILPPPSTRTVPDELQRLWNEAAYTSMLHMRAILEQDAQATLSRTWHMGITPPRVKACTSGSKTTTLNDRTIALFDTLGAHPRVLAQRPLNDLKETVGNGPWLKVTPAVHHELALSSDGSLLAVAQDRTIQIYDLLAPPDSFSVNEYITSAAGHYICGIDFEQDDHMLRVRLSGKGSVLYLGSPPTATSHNAPATIGHWKSKGGLKHTFLDTTLLTLRSHDGSGEHNARVSGLQLLRKFQDGFLFASQKHGGNESSHYILGYVKCSMYSQNAAVLTAEPGSLVVLARLESFLSAWDYTFHRSSVESGVGSWESMPSAHEHHPRFTLSPDGSALILAERDKKSIRAKAWTQLFIYRLPSEVNMVHTLQLARSEGQVGRTTPASILSGLEVEQRQLSMSEANKMTTRSAGTVEAHKVGRLPVCLATIHGEVVRLRFESTTGRRDGKGPFTLIASTDETQTKLSISGI